MKVRAWMAICVCVVLVSVACSSSADDAPVVDDPATMSTTATPSTTVTTEVPTTTVPEASTNAAGLEIEWEQEVVYHTDAEGEWTMDILYPSEGGPWPLVVVYHGMTTTPSISEARAIAATGAVAVAPRWLLTTAPYPSREQYIDGGLFDRAACATAVAQGIATRYGADAANTTIAGFSAGVHPAGWVGLGIVREDVCGATLLHQPTGLVLGDSQLIFYEDGWDESFADLESPAADTTDRFVNPERWELDPDIAVYLWTSDYRHGRDAADPPPADSWIRSRDTTGDLVTDLDALAAFDDEFVDWKDNARLLEMRLAGAGYSVVREEVGGGHEYGDTVFTAIDALIHRDPVAAVNAQTGWVWPTNDTLTDLAASFCAEFPDVGALLHEQVSLAVVAEEGWDVETSEVLRGREVIADVLGAQEVVAMECGDLVVQADWVAIPYVLVEPFGPEFEGVFVLKSTSDGEATWIAWYRSLLGQDQPFEAVADAAMVAEAMATCEAIEGHMIARDADAYLESMTGDPAIHSIPNNYHATGEEGVRLTVSLYPSGDDIGCVDRTTGTATWSVVGMTIDNPGYGVAVEGPVVHRHTAGGIAAIYHHWTDAGMSPGLGAGTWGTAPAP